jgi:hypothetical protein
VARTLDERAGRKERCMSRRRPAAVVVIAVLMATRSARAQTTDAGSGASMREARVSTGYASVQLPPVALGGVPPADVLTADLITTASLTIDWRRVRPLTEYTLEASGVYATHARYSPLSAPGADVTCAVTHRAGIRWRLEAAADAALTNADQLAFQPRQSDRLVNAAGSVADLANALTRSPDPDRTQAELFEPLRESLDASDVYGNRIFAWNARAEAIYSHSNRLAMDVHSNYTAVRRVSSNNDPGPALPFPDSAASRAGAELTYDRTERSRVTATVDWSQTSGAYADAGIVATAGYEWSGRKSFAEASAGAAVRLVDAAAPLATTTSERTPAIVGRAAVGYRFGGQTLFAQYRRSSHDEYGHGGRNVATGFQGNVQSFDGSWAWSVPHRSWMTHATVSMLRGPGNFTYIYAWLTTFEIGRELGHDVRLTGELLFDRHGSRAFEGFALMREGAQLTLIWTPQRRPVR